MAKQKTNQKYIYKINTSRLRKNKWNLKLSFDDAVKNNEVISLSDSQVLRFIDDINGVKDREEKINYYKNKIKSLSKKESTSENLKIIKSYTNEFNKWKLVKDYICIVVDKKTDFDRCNKKKGFYINDIKYKRLLGTTGGIKNNTIVYVNETIYDELNKRINNGRDIEKKLVPAKFEAYKALSCSASIPVSDPKGILVVKDCVTKFKDTIITIKEDEETKRPLISEPHEDEIELIDSDGYGLITPKLSKKWAEDVNEDYLPSGFCIRNAFTKGMVFTFDFHDFADKIAKKYEVEDVWGNKHDIKDIDIILTESMLKLWDSYNSIEHYLNCCKENHYTFSITKICPEVLENQRTLNYQFIQSFELSDEDIKELVYPTIRNIKDSLCNDYAKTVLFLRGNKLTEKTAFQGEFDYSKALMIDKRMLNDDYVRQKILDMRMKRINDAKIGVLDISGCYTIIGGDPYSLCQSIFGLEVTGLLKRDECYSKYWKDKNIKEVLGFRAPMTCHNNIRKLKISDNKEAEYWFKYIKTCLLLNSWDTVTHAENGADKDSDAFITTDNEVLLRNFKPLPALFCEQKSTTKKIVVEEDLIKSNKNGFGDEIGTITNRITEMFDVLVKFEKDTKEYKEVMRRIQCGQHFQQIAIDKIKGIKSEPMPREWYDIKDCMDKDEDSEETKKIKEFNRSIIANKKPYFFIYIYPTLMKKYKQFVRETSDKCMAQFNMTIDELFSKTELIEEEYNFIKYYEYKNPVSDTPSTMNRICNYVEEEFKNIKNKDINMDFDYSFLKYDIEYSKSKYKKINKLYNEYNAQLKEFKISNAKKRISNKERKNQKDIKKAKFKEECLRICNNKAELTNILLDMCYKTNKSKSFVWDLAGEDIIENLFNQNNNEITYFELDNKGEIEYCGYRFAERKVGRNDI